MSNLWKRAITGALFVVAIVAAIIFKSWVFHAVFGLIGFLGLHEFYGLFKNSKATPYATLGLMIGCALYVLGIVTLYIPAWEIYLKGAALLSFGIIALAELYRKKKHPFENIGIALTGIIYIILPMLLLNYMIEFSQKTFTITNYWPVLSIFILVWCSDTFAYLVGRQIGKHKLFERISPKKSWEGFFGGLFFSVLGGLIIAYFTDSSYIQFAVYGFIISTFGTLGDLVESMLKRSVGVKDSGHILPGHGGILDRFDAVLFVIPVIYILHHYLFI